METISEIVVNIILFACICIASGILFLCIAYKERLKALKIAIVQKIVSSRLNNRKQRKLKAEFSKLDKPDCVQVDLDECDIIYHKKHFWGVYEFTGNLVIYSEKYCADTLYYLADFLIFLRKRYNIVYGYCKGRKDRYDFLVKMYGADFIKEVRPNDKGESVYRFKLSDNAIKVSRKIKRCIRLRNLTKRKKTI